MMILNHDHHPESRSSFNHHFDENTIHSISVVTILRLVKLHLHLIPSNSLVPLTTRYEATPGTKFHVEYCCHLREQLTQYQGVHQTINKTGKIICCKTVLPWIVSNAHPDSSKSLANLMVAVTVCLGSWAPKSTSFVSWISTHIDG